MIGAEGRSLLRFAGAALAVLLLVLLGVAIGSNMWPRVAHVEQQVVAPVRAAAAGRSGLDAIPDLVDQTCPSLVLLRPAGPAAQDAQPAHKPASRTRKTQLPKPDHFVGFFVASDGHFLGPATAPGKQGLEAVLNDGRVLPAQQLAADDLSGLAMYKVDAVGMPVLPFLDEGFPRTGDIALAIDTPQGTGCSVEAQMVSADFLAYPLGLKANVQLRPGLNPLNAGLPVIDLSGQLIGIAGLIAGSSEEGSSLLPASTAARISGELLRNGSSPELPFGFQAEDVGPVLAQRTGAARGRGALVSLVASGSPADRAGLRAGDVILAAGGAPVSSAAELARILDGQSSSGQVALDVQRQSGRVSLTLTGSGGVKPG